MLFAEEDASLLKAWIVKRLANTSDADADVLADYVLALLRHDSDIDAIRGVFEEEIPDFLRDDAGAFIEDLFQAVRYRSYLPGAPPPPATIRHSLPPAAAAHPPSRPEYRPQLPYGAAPIGQPFPQSASRKRPYNDRDDNDVDIILTSQNHYGGPQPFKQPRRGGSFPQRGRRFDDSYGYRGQRGGPGPYQSVPGPGGYGAPQPPFSPSQQDPALAPIDPNSIIENIQRLQQLGIPIPQLPELPRPTYSGSAMPPPRRRKQRCRDYDMKGYCSRGNNCLFEHGPGSLYIPPPGPSAGEEYDPTNASMALPNFNSQPPPTHAMQLPDPSVFQMTPTTNRREPKKPRRTKGRPPLAAKGPVHDKSKTTIMVQNIPNEHFHEEEVRGYFSQFGNVVEISMDGPNRLAIVKFDTWDSAHAAWSSPKVIFDNRFVKVFWRSEDADGGPTPNGKHVGDAKNGATNGDATTAKEPSAEPFDMDDFMRKQEEAQKLHDEKTRKRQELERQRQELEERQKELRARQLDEKRKLEAKLTNNGAKDSSSSPAEIQTEGTGKKSSAQTEALRAQLAALEEEANVLGIDPDVAQYEWTSRGRGRGSRGFRGRGRFPPRALRGGYAPRGRGGIQARHAAYAAYSLDNRPKIIALTGVDFTAPEKDEALRQYLFGIGEFQEIHADPTTTHITFKDRKTAEQFMFGVSANNTIPGLDDKIEPTWATSAPQSEANATATDDLHMASGLEDEQAAKAKDGIAENGTVADLEEGEVGDAHARDQGDMDYEAGEWDM
ncbi:hypothetical protein F5B20DRAFT_52004 [Whalleya microplaca]|nr:hypothetical protein F5B20DRAFT_52004 [Whalleya microplaca]